MSTSESQFDNFEDAAVNDFGQTPTAVEQIINVTNVNPHLPGLDPNQVQLPFWHLVALVAAASLAVGELVGLLILR